MAKYWLFLFWFSFFFLTLANRLKLNNLKRHQDVFSSQFSFYFYFVQSHRCHRIKQLYVFTQINNCCSQIAINGILMSRFSFWFEPRYVDILKFSSDPSIHKHVCFFPPCITPVRLFKFNEKTTFFAAFDSQLKCSYVHFIIMCMFLPITTGL